jgi:transposase-like protein
MTDDSDAERAALSSTFPSSTLILCQFHVQQAMWRWLWDSNHHVAKEERRLLMQLFKKIVNAGSVEEYEESVEKLRHDKIAKRYGGFMK